MEWKNGNAIEKIDPYRKLRASDLAFKTDKVPLSKASFLMKELTKISEENQISKAFAIAPLRIEIGPLKPASLFCFSGFSLKNH